MCAPMYKSGNFLWLSTVLEYLKGHVNELWTDETVMLLGGTVYLAMHIILSYP